MKYEDYVELVKLLVTYQERQDKVLKTVPVDISVFLTDNSVSNSLAILNDRLVDFILKDDLYLREHTYWYLYDARTQPRPTWGYDNKEYVVDTLEKFLASTKEAYFFQA